MLGLLGLRAEFNRGPEGRLGHPGREASAEPELELTVRFVYKALPFCGVA